MVAQLLQLKMVSSCSWQHLLTSSHKRTAFSAALQYFKPQLPSTKKTVFLPFAGCPSIDLFQRASQASEKPMPKQDWPLLASCQLATHTPATTLHVGTRTNCKSIANCLRLRMFLSVTPTNWMVDEGNKSKWRELMHMWKNFSQSPTRYYF